MAHTDPLSIRQLEIFVALVEHGSFTKAARQLGLSQSTVSGHIADLEKRLGVRLVGRERSGTTPTGAGEVLLKPARDALRAERTARMAAAELTGLLRGSLRIGGSTIPAVYLIPTLLRAFHGAHDAVTIHLITGDSAEIVERVQSGDVDVAVVGTKPEARGLQSAPIGDDELVVITPLDHPLADRGSVGYDLLRSHPLILREQGSGTRQAMLQALGVEDDHGLQVSCHVGSTEAVKAAVRAGLGISLVSRLAVEDELAAKTLSVVRVMGLDAKRRFHLVSRPTEDLSPAARAFWTESLGQ